MRRTSVRGPDVHDDPCTMLFRFLSLSIIKHPLWIIHPPPNHGSRSGTTQGYDPRAPPGIRGKEFGYNKIYYRTDLEMYVTSD